MKYKLIKENKYVGAKINLMWSKLYTYKYLKKLKAALEKKLEELNREYASVSEPSSPRFDKIVVSENHIPTSSMQLEIIDKKDEVLKELNSTIRQMNEIERIISSIKDDEIRKYAYSIFIEGKTQEQMAEKSYRHRKTIEKHIKAELEAIIEEEKKEIV